MWKLALTLPVDLSVMGTENNSCCFQTELIKHRLADDYVSLGSPPQNV